MSLLIILAAIAYGLSIISIRGSQFYDSNLFGAVVNIIGTIIPLSLFMVALQQKTSAPLTGKGLSYAIFGGLAIGTFIVLITKIFSSGQNLSYVSPLVWGGGILIATIVGITVFGEKVNILSVVGILTIITGISVLSYSSYLNGAIK
jgi:uncharacterized membrane protein